MTDGLVVVDKPAGWTSHDVVARIRRLAGTRRVGHAGTLDPMATGVLIVGVGRATRLLGYLAGHDKDYDATIRLGVTTTTDDCEGEVITRADAGGVSDRTLWEAMRSFVGDLDQVPSAVSAVKVGGVRSYARVRAGQPVELAPRRVHVAGFDVVARRGADIDVRVSCSTGTYVRALARDLGAALGVGGHLTSLRRTRVGSFRLDRARTLDQLAERFEVVPLGDAVAGEFPRRDVDGDAARRLAYGQRLVVGGLVPGPVGVFGPGGELVALVEERDGVAQPLVVFAGGSSRNLRP